MAYGSPVQPRIPVKVDSSLNVKVNGIGQPIKDSRSLYQDYSLQMKSNSILNPIEEFLLNKVKAQDAQLKDLQKQQ